MASPPYNHGYASSMSPPYPSNAQLPQPPKRRQTDMPSSGPANKRRKASMMSTTSAGSTHPLRQTSYPPEFSPNATYSRSPSVDTMSLVSGSVAGAPKKKRGRKSKNAVNDDTSILGGRGKSEISEQTGRNKRRGSNASEFASEEDVGGEEMAVETVTRTQEEREKEVQQRVMLVQQLDEEQFSRYEVFRSSKLQESVVRRIVNQTLSQSAPHSVILAVRSVAKLFAGEMIEGARKVQSQWLEVSEEPQTSLPSPPADVEKPKEKDARRGPLMADHLREAMSRYKLERDGGLAGELGLWQAQQSSGVERFGVKLGGKRLMK